MAFYRRLLMEAAYDLSELTNYYITNLNLFRGV